MNWYIVPPPPPSSARRRKVHAEAVCIDCDDSLAEQALWRRFGSDEAICTDCRARRMRIDERDRLAESPAPSPSPRRWEGR